MGMKKSFGNMQCTICQLHLLRTSTYTNSTFLMILSTHQIESQSSVCFFGNHEDVLSAVVPVKCDFDEGVLGMSFLWLLESAGGG